MIMSDCEKHFYVNRYDRTQKSPFSSSSCPYCRIEVLEKEAKQDATELDLMESSLRLANSTIELEQSRVEALKIDVLVLAKAAINEGIYRRHNDCTGCQHLTENDFCETYESDSACPDCECAACKVAKKYIPKGEVIMKKVSENATDINLSNEPWTTQDEARCTVQMDRVFASTNPDDLPCEEKDELVLLLARKMKTYVQSPKREKFNRLVAQSFSLVNDLVADGAVLTSSDKAKLGNLLIDAGENMVEIFLLIKKAGRIGRNQSPRVQRETP